MKLREIAFLPKPKNSLLSYKLFKLSIMQLAKELLQRNGELCELCNNHAACTSYPVIAGNEDAANCVALCAECEQKIMQEEKGEYWRCLEGSIWSPQAAVQALSYRLLFLSKEQDWANETLNSVELNERVVQIALSIFEQAEVHKDAFGNALSNGDTVVLTQALNVKGTSFSAAKGTVVKKIRLVPDNAEHIEGKINEQTIVILTKYVKKN